MHSAWLARLAIFENYPYSSVIKNGMLELILEVGMRALSLIFSFGAALILTAGGLLADNSEIPNSGRGTFELKWEPKQCVTTPCPQFSVLKFGNQKVEGFGADLDRKNFEKSAMTNFQTFFVKGSYERDAEHPEYLKIKVSSWYGIVKENFSSSPSKR